MEPRLKILRRPVVEEMTGLSRSSIYAHMQAGSFPKAVHLGTHSVGWPESEVRDWIQSRIRERNHE